MWWWSPPLRVEAGLVFEVKHEVRPGVEVDVDTEVLKWRWRLRLKLKVEVREGKVVSEGC